MSARQPAGTIKQRADGSVWVKPTTNAKEWTQVKDGGPGGAGAKKDAPVPQNPATQTEPSEETVARPWQQVQLKYGLDGHLPTEEIHPQHVVIDSEGNIDAKPVMMWKDAYGADKRTYTMRFHWNRYAAAHEHEKANWDNYQLAHQSVRDLAAGGSQAALAALVALHTGRSPEDVCSLHHERVETTNEEGVAKGDSADRQHPDRVHVTFKHRRGYAYTASINDPVLARYAGGKKVAPNENGKVFNTSAKKVRALFAKAGIDPDSDAVRRHVATNMAVDLLSKTPPLKLAEHGSEAIRATLMEVSDKIAQHFGHDPAPEGMSYVPPGVQLAYLEECGGARAFPVSFAKLKGKDAPAIKKGSPRERAERVVLRAFGTLEGNEARIEEVAANIEKRDTRVRKGPECSLTEPDSSFPSPTSTASPLAETPSSTPTTPEPRSSSLGPSVPFSELELSPPLEKGETYIARLSPLAGDKRARYVYDVGALRTFIESPLFTSLVGVGNKFLAPINGVHGYFVIEDRNANLVTLSHTSTGERTSTHVDNLRTALLKLHPAPEPTAPEPAPELMSALAEKLLEAAKTYIKDKAEVSKGGVEGSEALSDIGTRQPQWHQDFNEARESYTRALRANLIGDFPDEIMRLVNDALYERRFGDVIRLVDTGMRKGETTAPSAPSVSSPTTASAGGSHPGPKGMPIGTQTQRRSGQYEKVGQGDWKRTPKGREHRAPEISVDKLSTSQLRDLLARLRSMLSTAPKGQRNQVKERIEMVKRRLQSLHQTKEATHKADQQIATLVKSATEVSDPLEAWLRREEESYTALDDYMAKSDKAAFADFALDLVDAPLEVRSQANMLRLRKGDSAIKTRWVRFNGGE